MCEKVSVKFDPFCFLSVPVPAKERPCKSNVTFIRSPKWARVGFERRTDERKGNRFQFAITHTNKTTAGQVIETIKKSLELPEQQKVRTCATSCNYSTKKKFFCRSSC